jgi:hypothetical protein
MSPKASSALIGTTHGMQCGRARRENIVFERRGSGMRESRVLLSISALVATSACSTLYDANREAATAQVAKDYEKTDTKEYFASLRSGYDELEVKERAVRQRRSITIRDLDVLTALAPVPLTPHEQDIGKRSGGMQTPTGTGYLRTIVASRIDGLTGCSRPGEGGSRPTCTIDKTGLVTPTTQLLAWRAIPAKRPDALQRVDSAKAEIARFAKAAPDGTSTPVAAIAASCGPPVLASDLTGAWQELGSAEACVLQQVSAFGGSGGSIGNLLERILRSSREEAAALQEAQLIKARIAELSKKPRADPRLLDEIEKLRAKLEDAKTPSIARTVGFDKVGDVLEDLLAVELGNATQDKPGDQGKEPSALTQKAQTALQLVGAVQKVADSYRAMPPAQRASALLIAITAQRQAFDMAFLEAQYQADIRRLDQRELEAALMELSQLARAEIAIDAMDAGHGSRRRSDDERTWLRAALIAYGASFSEGRFPAQQVDQARRERRRDYRIDAVEHTASNRRALLAPAIAQIEAAGKAGLKPELVATVLSQLGLGFAVLEN